jgi:hypothetical protein
MDINPSRLNELDINYIFLSACQYDLIDIAKYLIEKYPSIEISDEAICSACESNNDSIVAKWLMQVQPNIAKPHKVFELACIHRDILLAEMVHNMYPNNVCAINDNIVKEIGEYMDSRFNLCIILWFCKLNPFKYSVERVPKSQSYQNISVIHSKRVCNKSYLLYAMKIYNYEKYLSADILNSIL